VTATSSRGQTDKRPLRSRSPRILVIDDEPLIRLWLRQSLAERGYRVFEAEDENAAFATLADGPLPEIVLLDHPLSDVKDFALLRRLLKRAPRVRVIEISAEHAAGTPADARAAGAFAVINKPFEIQELLALLDHLALPTAAE